MNILVTGATGYIGGRLVPRLLERGHQVRCLARDPARLSGRPGWESVSIVGGDVLQPDTLPPALSGIDVAYYLVHSMGGGEKEFAERDRQAASHFARAARLAGVKRLIYLGGLGVASTGLSRHLASRHETGDVLRAEGPPVTEFRAAIIVGSGSISFEMIRVLTERLPVMICPRWVSTRCQPIAIRQVLAYLIQCLEKEESTGKILEIGGPDVLTYAQMMLQYASVRGLRRWLIPVPVLTPRLSSLWVDLVTPIPAQIARPLIEGLRHEVIVRDRLAETLFPEIESIRYKQAVQVALDRIESHHVETVWSMALSTSTEPGQPPRKLKSHDGLYLEQAEQMVPASAHHIYRTFLGIGGEHGWFVFNWAWHLRAWMDRALGGVGFRRGRRDPDELVAGEVVDWWRVEELIPDRRLRLRAEMKLPGRGWLQFEVVPISEQESHLKIVAFFEPKGLLGIAYWYALKPIHPSIFRGLTRAIAERAVANQAAETETDPPRTKPES